MQAFINAKVVLSDKIRNGVVLVDNGKIVDVAERADEGIPVIDCGGAYLTPGFVDVHVHGGGGYSAMSHDPDDIVKMAKAHLAHGTTSIVPTTLASTIENLHGAMDAIDAAMEKSKEAHILGIHLEGPYISLQFKGAQSPDDILTPAKKDPAVLLDHSRNIRLMGAAPEIEGGVALGREITRRGIVASVAHSAATYDVMVKALENGYSDVTHIYSACSSCTKINNFRVGGVVEGGLSLDGYTTQFIGDLRHLPVELLRIIYKCKGADLAYGVSDGLEFAALEMQEGEVYRQQNGLSVVYEDGVMKLADRSCLAGSVTTMSAICRNLVAVVGVPLVEAVRMCSTTPARVVGFGDRKGKIAKGYDADFVLLDDELCVKAVYTDGICR